MLQAVKKKEQRKLLFGRVLGHAAKENGVLSTRGLGNALFKFKYLRKNTFCVCFNTSSTRRVRKFSRKLSKLVGNGWTRSFWWKFSVIKAKNIFLVSTRLNFHIWLLLLPNFNWLHSREVQLFFLRTHAPFTRNLQDPENLTKNLRLNLQDCFRSRAWTLERIEISI